MAGQNAEFKFTSDELAILNTKYAQNFVIFDLPYPNPLEDRFSIPSRKRINLNIIVYASVEFVIAVLFDGIQKVACRDVEGPNAKVVVDPPIQSASASSTALIDFISYLVARNEAIAYRVQQSIRLISKVNNQYVFFKLNVDEFDFEEFQEYTLIHDINILHRMYDRFRLLTDKDRRDKERKEEFDSFVINIMPITSKIILKKLDGLQDDFETISNDIKKFKIGAELGARSDSNFHVIEKDERQKGGAKWTINALRARKSGCDTFFSCDPLR